MLSAGPEILILITACECHNTAREEPPTSSGGSGPGVPGREEFLCNNVRVTSAHTRGSADVTQWLCLSWYQSLLDSAPWSLRDFTGTRIICQPLTSPRTQFKFLWHCFNCLVQMQSMFGEVAWESSLELWLKKWQNKIYQNWSIKKFKVRIEDKDLWLKTMCNPFIKCDVRAPLWEAGVMFPLYIWIPKILSPWLSDSPSPPALSSHHPLSQPRTENRG